MKAQRNQRWDTLRRLVALYEYEDGPALRLLADDPLRVRRIKVPKVFVEPKGEGPDRICWDATEVTQSPDIGDCLWSFVELAHKPDADIVRFARRWGPL